MRPSRFSVGGVRGPFDGELPLDGRRDSRLYLIRRSRIVGDRVTTGGGTAGEAQQQYRCSQGQGGSLIRSAHRLLPPAVAAARVGKSQRRPRATETLHASAAPCHPHVTNPPWRASRPHSIAIHASCPAVAGAPGYHTPLPQRNPETQKRQKLA